MVPVWLDLTRYWTDAATAAVNPRSVWYNLAAGGFTNGTSVGTVSFTVALYPVAGITAGAPTLGSLISGSAVTFANPTTNVLLGASYSGDFIAPAAGWYALAVQVSANMAASSVLALAARLSMRQV